MRACRIFLSCDVILGPTAVEVGYVVLNNVYKALIGRGSCPSARTHHTGSRVSGEWVRAQMDRVEAGGQIGLAGKRELDQIYKQILFCLTS